MFAERSAGKGGGESKAQGGEIPRTPRETIEPDDVDSSRKATRKQTGKGRGSAEKHRGKSTTRKKRKSTATKTPARKTTARSKTTRKSGGQNIDLRALKKMLTWSLDLADRQRRLILSALEMVSPQKGAGKDAPP